MKSILLQVVKTTDVPGQTNIELYRVRTTDLSIRQLISAVAEKSLFKNYPADPYLVRNKNLPVIEELGLWPFSEVAEDELLRVFLWSTELPDPLPEPIPSPTLPYQITWTTGPGIVFVPSATTW